MGRIEGEPSSLPIFLVERLVDYVTLCKPKVVLAFLFLFFLSYLIAITRYWPFPSHKSLLVSTVGVLTSIGGANVLNNYIDRDIDSIMYRTRRRPIPSGKIRPELALAFGSILSSISLVISIYLGIIPLVIFLSGFSSYVVVYSLLMKRRLALNVIFTAPAVASPVWFGWWSAVGKLDISGFLVGLSVAFWGILHFWSLTVVFSRDYSRVNVPVLVLRVRRELARWHIFISAVILLLYSFLLSLILDCGIIYLAIITPPSIYLGFLSYLFLIEGRSKYVWRLFKFTTPYIIIVLVGILLDSLLSNPTFEKLLISMF